MSRVFGLRATSAVMLIAALAGGIAAGWLIGAGGSGGAEMKAKQAVPAAVAHVATSIGQTDTVTITQTRTVTEPIQTVTATETHYAAPPTTTFAHTTTNVAVIPTSTTAEQAGDQIPWWGWLLIGLGVAVVGIGLFAAGHRHGTRGAEGARGGGGTPAGG